MSCEWPVDRSCLPALPADNDPEYQERVDRMNMATDTAVMVLWQLTGQQFGICPTSVRPCPTGPRYPDYGVREAYWSLLFWSGEHWFTGNCGCVGRCQLSGPAMVHLPGPVADVTKVQIGDTVLDPSEYVLEQNRLYRKGGAAWPSQNLGRPIGETGTWVVEYTKGLPVPPGGDKMAGILAQEFIRACDNDGDCRIPRTVVQISRQGVSHVFDATKMLANGKTGLAEVDLWLNAINPYHLLSRPTVI